MNPFLKCLGRRSRVTNLPRLSEDDTTRSVHSFIEILFGSEKSGMDLRLALDGIVVTNDWKQDSAAAVFEALQKAIQTARQMSDLVWEIHRKVISILSAIEGFGKDYQVSCALAALGILVILSPRVIELIGFTEGGILKGKNFIFQNRHVHYHQESNTESRFFRSIIPIETCSICPSGLFVFPIAKTRHERFHLRKTLGFQVYWQLDAIV